MAVTQTSEVGILRALAAHALQAGSLEDLADRSCHWVAHALPQAICTAVLLARRGQPVWVAAAGAPAAVLVPSDLEADGVGDPEASPARFALATGRVISCPDLDQETRWKPWRHRAAAAGIGGVYAYPLIAGALSIGALAVCTRRDAPLTMQVDHRTRSMADILAVTLTAAQRNYGHKNIVEHLQTALTNRPVIDQAVGILLARHGHHPQGVLAAMRHVSQHLNVPVHDLAADIVRSAVNGNPAPAALAMAPSRGLVEQDVRPRT